MRDEVLAGRYLLLDKVGEGGMGSVWRALDKRTGQDVAVKLLRSSLSDKKHSRKRFAREIQATAQLHHPGIVKILDHGEDGRPFLVMELLTGLSLRKYIRKTKPSVEQILILNLELCDALAHAHSRGIIHRDLKPDNVFVSHSGHIKILDFGLARMVKNTNLSVLTRAGTALGTCSYMAPEQATGRESDCRADLYALGVMLYEFLCGMTPFSADEPASVLYMQVHQEPEPPCEVNPDLPVEVGQLILWLMNKNPENRPSSALVLKDKIIQIINLMRARTGRKPLHAVFDAVSGDYGSRPNYGEANALATIHREAVPHLNGLEEEFPFSPPDPTLAQAVLSPGPGEQSEAPRSSMPSPLNEPANVAAPKAAVPSVAEPAMSTLNYWRGLEPTEEIRSVSLGKPRVMPPPLRRSEPRAAMPKTSGLVPEQFITSVTLLIMRIHNFFPASLDLPSLETSRLMGEIFTLYQSHIQQNSGQIIELVSNEATCAFTGTNSSLRAIHTVACMRTELEFIRQSYNILQPISLSAGVFTDALPPGHTSQSLDNNLMHDSIAGANRLEFIARTNSNETIINRESLDPRLLCQPLRTIFLKNRPAPVHVYRLISYQQDYFK